MKKFRFFVYSFTLCLFSQTFCIAQLPKFNWAKSIGGTRDVTSTSVAVDAAGSVYTTGYYQGSADFDPGPGTYNLTGGNTFNNSFISKLDSAGKFVWAKSFGNATDSAAAIFSIAADTFGHIYVTGYFGSGAYISKLDTAGNSIWTEYFNGNYNAYARPSSIAVDRSGNVFTTGYVAGTVDFDPGDGKYPLTGSDPWDIFVSKLDSSGRFKWARVMGSNDYDESRSITVDDLGNVYTTGWFRGSGDFDPGPGTHILTSKNYQSSFIAKLDAAGNFLWAKSLGDSTSTNIGGFSITIDKSGNVFTTGTFDGTADFDPGPGTYYLTSWSYSNTYSDLDAYISKLDASGNFLWAKNFGGRSSDYGVSMALDASGNIYISGIFYDTADFDPGPGTYNLVDNFDEVYISKLDASANFISAVKTNSSQFPNLSSMILDKRGNVYLTGAFIGTMDFDDNTATDNSLKTSGFQYYNIYIAKFGDFPFIGTYRWTGNADNNWNNPANWSCNCIPPTGSNITIPAGTASLNGDIALENITLEGSLNLNGHTLTINGVVTGSGTFIGSATSGMIINGTADPLKFSQTGGRLLLLQVNSGAVVTVPSGSLVVGP